MAIFHFWSDISEEVSWRFTQTLWNSDVDYRSVTTHIQHMSGIFIIMKYIYNPLLIDVLVAYEVVVT